jgi:hypothetical protein
MILQSHISVLLLKVFYLRDPIDCTPETSISGMIALKRQNKNKRLYNVEISMKIDDGAVQDFCYEMP